MKNSEKHQVGTSLLLLGMGMLMGEENASGLLDEQNVKSSTSKKKKGKKALNEDDNQKNR